MNQALNSLIKTIVPLTNIHFGLRVNHNALLWFQCNWQRPICS